VPLLKGLSEKQRAELAAALKQLAVPKGSAVVTQVGGLCLVSERGGVSSNAESTFLHEGTISSRIKHTKQSNPPTNPS